MSKNKRHIVYLVSRLRRQGPYFQLYNIVKYLDRETFHPHVITLSPEVSDSLMPAFRKIGVDCSSLGLSRITDMVLGPKKIRKFLSEKPVDLIHANGLRATILCANHLSGIPRLVTCRQVFHQIGFALNGNTYTVSNHLRVKLFSTACKKCERIVAVSDFVKSSAKGGYANQIDVIHNGVDQDIFKPIDENTKTKLRSKLGLPQNKRVFVSVGALSKRKNPMAVIDGFLNSKASQTGILILLGNGHLRKKCSRLADKVKNVRIVGFVENVKDYLVASDIFVSASLTEGCPNAVIEALACGLAVILSDIPAHMEILAFDSKAGVTFNTGNIDSLVQAYEKIDQQEYSIRSQAALKIVNNQLSARRMSLKYQQVYTELYNEHFGNSNTRNTELQGHINTND